MSQLEFAEGFEHLPTTNELELGPKYESIMNYIDELYLDEIPYDGTLHYSLPRPELFASALDAYQREYACQLDPSVIQLVEEAVKRILEVGIHIVGESDDKGEIDD